MELIEYALVAVAQTAVFALMVGKWVGRIDTRMESVEGELAEHKALPSSRAHAA